MKSCKRRSVRGSSVSDYVDTDGRRGSFQNRHRVYGRENQPCVTCGTPIRKIVVAGPGYALLPEVPALRTFLRAALGRPTPAGTLWRAATPRALRTKRSRWTPTAWPIVAARERRWLPTTRALITLLPHRFRTSDRAFRKVRAGVGRQSCSRIVEMAYAVDLLRAARTASFPVYPRVGRHVQRSVVPVDLPSHPRAAETEGAVDHRVRAHP